MTTPFQAVGRKILVKIDTHLRKKKTTLASGLIIPPAYEYMQYYLQLGEIVSIGDEIADPSIQLGRTAIFHHRIEDDAQNLIDVLEDRYEIRVVRVANNFQSSSMFYGVIDEQGQIIPHIRTIFCKPHVAITGEIEELFDDNTLTRVKFATEKVGSLYLAKVPQNEEDIKHYSCEVLHVNGRERKIEPGDRITFDAFAKYPLTIHGREYWLVPREYVLTKTLA
jgi:hypothetical protein